MNENKTGVIELSQFTPTDNCLTNRIILITGAGDGLGKAIAVTAARYGATIILLGRTEKKLEAVYEEIESLGAPEPVLCPFDLEKADEAAYRQLASMIHGTFSRLDGIVHNAAILGNHSPIANSSYEWWQKVMQVNLNAPYLITRECYPLLTASNSASVIFSSDTVARTGQAYWGAYAVSKAGSDNLMKIVASEWETNTAIQVNSLDPGPVRTALRRSAYPGEDPGTLPAAEETVLPYLYLLDTKQHQYSGLQFVWAVESQSLSAI